MGEYAVNFKARNPIRIINALKELDQASSKRLAEVTNLARGSVTVIIKALCDAKMIHISAWEPNKTIMMTPIYKWGPGTDVPEPVFISKAERSNLKNTSKPWPRADVAAAWLRNSI
jgi:hypothetical protein